MIYTIPKTLLSTKNSKTIKGEKFGYTTYIMYLAPHTQNSKGANLCPNASAGCAKACLFNSGAARFTNVQQGKINKTEFYLDNRQYFMTKLVHELQKIEKRHADIQGDKLVGRTGKTIRYKKFAVRLNGTSDIPFENIRIFHYENDRLVVSKKPKKEYLNIFELFPNIQFYDYTKGYRRFNNVILPKNYHLTFSRSEENDVETMDILNRGYNVAVVFGVTKEQELPETYKGFKVINGDESDLRFLDDENVIVGLKYKFMTGKGTTGVNKDNLENNDFLIDVREKTPEKLAHVN